MHEVFEVIAIDHSINFYNVFCVTDERQKAHQIVMKCVFQGIMAYYDDLCIIVRKPGYGVKIWDVKEAINES